MAPTIAGQLADVAASVRRRASHPALRRQAQPDALRVRRLSGFADVQSNKSFVTDDAEAGIIGEGSIERGSNVVPSNTGERSRRSGHVQPARDDNQSGRQTASARKRASMPARERLCRNRSWRMPAGSLSIGANSVPHGWLHDSRRNALPLGTGLYLAPGFSGYQVVNNIITNNTFGMYLNSSGTTQTLVQHNLFASNNLAGSAAGNGIYADQGSKNILVDENKFTGNTNSAMVFAGAAGTQIRHHRQRQRSW